MLRVIRQHYPISYMGKRSFFAIMDDVTKPWKRCNPGQKYRYSYGPGALYTAKVFAYSKICDRIPGFFRKRCTHSKTPEERRRWMWRRKLFKVADRKWHDKFFKNWRKT